MKYSCELIIRPCLRANAECYLVYLLMELIIIVATPTCLVLLSKILHKKNEEVDKLSQ
jgi:hypothetical protein